MSPTSLSPFKSVHWCLSVFKMASLQEIYSRFQFSGNHAISKSLISVRIIKLFHMETDKNEKQDKRLRNSILMHDNDIRLNVN